MHRGKVDMPGPQQRRVVLVAAALACRTCMTTLLHCKLLHLAVMLLVMAVLVLVLALAGSPLANCSRCSTSSRLCRRSNATAAA